MLVIFVHLKETSAYVVDVLLCGFNTNVGFILVKDVCPDRSCQNLYTYSYSLNRWMVKTMGFGYGWGGGGFYGGSAFVLIVVLFILLIIVLSSWVV
jgi:uncharacterized protein (TIGR01732 family)